MVYDADHHATPDVWPLRQACGGAVLPMRPCERREYRPPTLTLYGAVRDLTKGVGIGPPDNGVSGSHSFSGPPGQRKS